MHLNYLGALRIMDPKLAALTLLSALSSSPPHSLKSWGTLQKSSEKAAAGIQGFVPLVTEQHKNTL